MQTSPEITFHGMSSSMWIESFVESWVSRLERSCGRLLRCSVHIDKPHHHRRHGNRFHVRIELAVPGRQFAVSRDNERDPAHEDVYAAISDAFRAVRRQLQDHAEASRQGVAART